MLENKISQIKKSSKYTAPKELTIAGIPAVVVDPHNEVLPYWHDFRERNKEPAVLFHIDAHSDMGGDIPTFDSGKKPCSSSEMKAYAAGVGIGNFITVGFHYDLVSSCYWLDSRLSYAINFGKAVKEIEERPRTVEKGNRIYWSDPKKICDPRSLEFVDLIKDLKSYKGPLILDIDLDAFECIGTDDEKPCKGLERMAKTFALLRKITTPGLITIARSQNTSSHNPAEFTPPDRVDFLQRMTIKRLKGLYEEKAALKPIHIDNIKEITHSGLGSSESYVNRLLACKD